MRERSIIIFCIVAILCVTAASATIIIFNNDNHSNNTSDENSTVNITLNETQNNTTTQKTTTKKSASKNYDPDYDPTRDNSHKSATRDHPVTVQQSDGEYTYYGPGHYDYYPGGNHMSGQYYKEMNHRKY